MLCSPENTGCNTQGLLVDYDYAFCSSLLFPLHPDSAQPPPLLSLLILCLPILQLRLVALGLPQKSKIKRDCSITQYVF